MIYEDSVSATVSQGYISHNSSFKFRKWKNIYEKVAKLNRLCCKEWEKLELT